MRARLGPAAGRLTYLALLVLAGAGAYLLNNRFGYTPLLFLLLLAPLDALCALRARRCLGAAGAPAYLEAEHGSPAVFRYAYANRSRFLTGRLDLLLRPAGPPGSRFKTSAAALELAPGAAGELALSLTARHIGVYRIRVKSARVRGPLGLVRLRIPAPRPAVLAVTPARGGAAAPEAGGGREEASARAARGGPNADGYNGVREFAPGDRLRSIHWKLTAHSRKLMSRLYEEEEEDYATVAVDLRPGPGTAEEARCIHDRLCESAFRAACARVRGGGKVRLVFCAGERLQSLRLRSEDDLPGAAVALAAAGPAAAALTELQGALPEAGELLAVSARADPELARRLGDFSGGRGGARLVLAAPPSLEAETAPAFFDYLTTRGVRCDIERTATARRARREGLRPEPARVRRARRARRKAK